MRRFEGKTVLVTGGSSGIGEATAKRLLDEGGSVIVTGRNSDKLGEVAQRLGGDGRVQTVVADAAKLGDIDDLMEQIRETVGQLDGIFANAGFGQFSKSTESDEGYFDAVFGSNVKGVFFTFTKALALLRRPSAVVLTASWTGHRGLPNGALYSATKAAVRSLTATLTSEFGHEGVRINSVSPGIIATPAISAMSDEEAAFWKTQTPLRRRGRPEDVAAVVAFLLSEDAAFVAGEDILIDGGLTHTVSMSGVGTAA